MQNDTCRSHGAILIGLSVLLSGCAAFPERLRSVEVVTLHAPTLSQPHQQSEAEAPTMDDTLPVTAPIALDVLDSENIRALDSERSPHADLWARMRSGFAIEPPTSALIDELARHYAARSFLEKTARRSVPMLYQVVAEIEQRQLPLELALIPFVESGFNPHARSPVGAHGPWQFMPRTGRDYGLTADRFGDRRRDWIASTRAALDYLQHLHQLFDGDWRLAIAAYNCGEAFVERARRRAIALGNPPLFDYLSLPAETREYVPRVFALKRLIEDPLAFGTSLPPGPDKPILSVVTLKRDIDVAIAARLAEISEARFRNLNPAITGPLIPAVLHPNLLLPEDNASKLRANLAVAGGPLTNWSARHISGPATATELSNRFNVNKATLLATNPLPAGHRYRSGSMILIPRRGSMADISTDQLAAAVLSTEPMQRKVIVRIAKGDSSEKLVRRYGVTLAQIIHWNPGISSKKLKAGQRVTLWLPVTRATKRA